MQQQFTILVADDDSDIREVLRLYLENAGYAVLEAADGKQALSLMEAGHASLCLLDIMMPEIDGYQVLKRLRETSNMPVIVISAKGQDPEKILGLDLGADDYLVKPFNPLEAVARVRSTLRRVHSFDAAPNAGASQDVRNILELDDLVLDLDSCQLTRAGDPVDLTLVEYRIMRMLMEHPGRVFTKQQLYECGWEEDYIAADNRLMVCMSKLRAKLSDNPQRYITTIRGLGYRLERC